MCGSRVGMLLLTGGVDKYECGRMGFLKWTENVGQTGKGK